MEDALIREVSEETGLCVDKYEADEGFTLEFLEPHLAIDVNRETILDGRFDPEKRHLFQIEIPNTMFTPYLYESQGIEISLSNSEIDTVFWNAAAPGVPTEGINDFLRYLKNKGIRTGAVRSCFGPIKVIETAKCTVNECGLC